VHWLVDGHVHFYEWFSLDDFLTAAGRNLERAAAALAITRWSGALLLTERAQDHWFSRWSAKPQESGTWSVTPGDDGITLVARCPGRPDLALVAGRQLRTSEGLEVLAIGTTREFPDQLALVQALQLVGDSDALTIVPWGVGKWLGRRGHLVRDLIDRTDPRSLFLGDNGGRARIAGYPRLLRYGRQRGFRVLPGSDPLPVSSQLGRVGSFGFVLEGDLRARSFASDLKAELRNQGTVPGVIGRSASLPVFLLAQARVHLGGRLG